MKQRAVVWEAGGVHAEMNSSGRRAEAGGDINVREKEE